MSELAFPGFDYINQYGKKNPTGMTLRDYFAAKAMQSFLSKDSAMTCPDNIIAQDAYNVADAMLEARK